MEKRTVRLLACCAIALLAISSNAYAGGCEGGHNAINVVVHIFDTADQDRDGVLTRVEYEDAGLQNYGVTFEQSDLDADGLTSLDEYIELYKFHHTTDGETEV